jgi:hypothetical protein
LLARSQETGRAVYNLSLMSEAEWAEWEVYRAAYSFHAMRQVLEVPIETRSLGTPRSCRSTRHERDPARDRAGDGPGLVEAHDGAFERAGRIGQREARGLGMAQVEHLAGQGEAVVPLRDAAEALERE